MNGEARVKTRRQMHRSPIHEEGYILVAAVFAVALVILFLSLAMPVVRKALQRDEEIETIHRGEQYSRAIQLYYRRFHAYPPNIDALIDSNGIRFLRKRYTDPITMKDDWRPIQFGRNKAPTAMGFFGQPLTMGAAISAGSNSQDAGDNTDSSTSSDNELPSDPNADFPSDTGSDSADSSASSEPGADSDAQEPVFGGGGIIGFSPVSHKPSILVYKTKSRYNEWEFVYDPLADWALRGQVPTQPPPGPPTNSGSPGFNPGSAGANPPADGSAFPTTTQ